MRAIYLALKDLRQILRDRKAAIFLLLMPIVFTVLMGTAFAGAGPTDARLPVVVANGDASGPLGAAVPELIEATGALRVVEAMDSSPEAAIAMVRENRAVAALVIPAGFGRGLLLGEPVHPTVFVDATTPAGQSARDALSNALARIASAAAAARASVDARAPATPFASDAARADALDESATRAVAEWAKPPLTVGREPVGAAAKPANAYSQSSPGMIVMFALFSLVLSATVVVAERRSGTLSRLLATSLGRAELVAGHTLAMFAVVFAQGLILVAVGQLAFGVDYLRNAPATLLVLGALALWVATLGLLIGLLAKGQEQVSLFGLVAMFVLSALGGAWFPLDGASESFAAVGRLLPSAWAMSGLQDIVVRGLAVDAVLPAAGVMVAYAAGFFGLAVMRFRVVE